LPEARLAGPDDVAGWREAARALLRADVPPERARFRIGDASAALFDAEPIPPPTTRPPPRVPRAFPPLAERAALHREPERFVLLYRLLWRLQQAPRLLELTTDADVARATELAKNVKRDAHKLHAFLRFREITAEDGPRFVAWFEPTHHILRAEAGFFVRRFAQLRWSILSPDLCAHWDGTALAFSPGARRSDAPAADAKEELWLAYFAAIFNPARLKPAAMRSEMPRKYWHNLPEAALIPGLIEQAPRRVAAMVADGVTAPGPQPQRLSHVFAESGGRESGSA
jgi:uracil-DNA glycosylase